MTGSALDGLDQVIHAPKRLAAMSMLASSTSTDFAFLRDQMQISESDLSKQMASLAAAGYVTVTKSRGRGGSTAYRITKSGRTAFDTHVAALRALLGSDVD